MFLNIASDQIDALALNQAVSSASRLGVRGNDRKAVFTGCASEPGFAPSMTELTEYVGPLRLFRMSRGERMSLGKSRIRVFKHLPEKFRWIRSENARDGIGHADTVAVCVFRIMARIFCVIKPAREARRRRTMRPPEHGIPAIVNT